MDRIGDHGSRHYHKALTEVASLLLYDVSSFSQWFSRGDVFDCVSHVGQRAASSNISVLVRHGFLMQNFRTRLYCVTHRGRVGLRTYGHRPRIPL